MNAFTWCCCPGLSHHQSPCCLWVYRHQQQSSINSIPSFSFFLSFFLSSSSSLYPFSLSLLCHSHSQLPFLCLSPSFHSFYTLDLLDSISTSISNSPRVYSGTTFLYSFFLFGILGFSLLEVLVGILTLPTWISKPTNQAAQSSHASQETLPQNYLFSRGHPPSRRVSLRDRAENPGVACVER